MLSVICFSKDRPLQLDAFLASLHCFSAIAYRQISVIYKTSAHISYDEVMGNYPHVQWIKESDFSADFRKCVAESDEYIMLCCDDMVFKQHFSPDTVIQALAARPEALAFNVRLGANLHSLPKLRIEGELLSWDWRTACMGEWHFPWEVSGAVYRRGFVASLLDRYDNLSNPNRLELYIAYNIHDDTAVTQDRLLCFWNSKCIVLTINRVQDEFENYFDDSRATDPATLYAEYQAGKRLNWPAFALKDYSRSHINGRDFMLVESPPNPTPAECQRLFSSMQTGMSARSLAPRIAFWSCANRIKNFLHPFIPRRLFALVWKFF